jgi:hypothetical protein
VTKVAIGGAEFFWRLVKTAQHRGISTESGIFSGPHSVFDIMQGVVPLEWTTILRRYGISAKGVQSIVVKVGKYFVSATHSEIWRPQCDAQVEQE